MNPTENADASTLRRLDDLVARGESLIAARRDPKSAGKTFPDFGEAYRRWNNAGKERIAKFSGASDARDWSAGWCRAMHTLDQIAAYCLKEHERQQAMLVELRNQLAADRAVRARAGRARATRQPPPRNGKQSCRGKSTEQLLADLRRVAKRLGKESVTRADYLRHGRFIGVIVLRRLGTWNKALAAAGLAAASRKYIPDLELLQNLDRVCRKLGRRPVHADIVKPLSKFSVSVYHRRFGGLPAALEACKAWKRDGTIPEERARPLKDRNVGDALRYKVFKRDHHKCVKCGRSPATDPSIILHVDHITPRIRGGRTEFKNLRTLCSKCNMGKGGT